MNDSGEKEIFSSRENLNLEVHKQSEAFPLVAYTTSHSKEEEEEEEEDVEEC